MVDRNRRPATGVMPPLLRPATAALTVFVSGFTALTFEVLWARRLALVFGGTIFAVTAVLCAYTLGVAFGAAAVGPRADRSARPLRLLAAALICLAVLGWSAHRWLIPLVASANAALFGTGPGVLWQRHLIRFGWSLLALLLPCLALGAVLPVVARCVAPSGERAGWRVGLVWAAGTAGAVAGALITGFVLIREWGITATLTTGALPCLVLGLLHLVVMLAASRRRPPLPRGERAGVRGKPSQTAGSSPSPRPSPWKGEGERIGSQAASSVHSWSLGAAVVLAGAAMLAGEALFIRALVFFLGGSTYTFTVVVATYLAGLALGAFLASLLVDRSRRPWLALGWIFVLAGLAVAGSLLNISHFDVVNESLAGPVLWANRMSVEAVATVLVVFVPAALSGMCIPFFMRLAAERGQVGRRVGWVSALYNVGAAAGAAAAILALVPAVGVQRAFVALAGLWLLLGAAVLARPVKRGGGRPAFYAARLACLAGLALCGFLLRDLRLFWPAVQRERPARTCVLYDEGPDALVTVVEQPHRGTRSLLINRMTQGDDSELGRIVQWRQGLIPMLLHPNPKRVCIVGLGTGATAYAASLLCEGTVDVVEMSPGVVEAARHFPKDLNGAIYDDPKVNIIVEDGRAFLQNTRDTYDVLTIDIIYPTIAGAGNVFSADFYRLCRKRLNHDGLLFHWIPAWQIQPEELASVDRALAWGFAPHSGPVGQSSTSFWCAAASVQQPVLGFAGHGAAWNVSREDVRRRMRDPDVAEILRRTGLSSRLDLLAHYVSYSSPYERLTGAARCNSDERPVVEFSVPRRWRFGAGESNFALVQSAQARPVGDWPAFVLRHVDASLRPDANEERRRAYQQRRRAVALVIAGQLASATGNRKAEVAAYEQAREMGWDDPVVRIFERWARCALLLGQAEEAQAAGEIGTAIGLARQAAEVDPDEPEAFGLLAECLVGIKRNREAIEHANHAIRLDPASARWRVILAMAQFNRQQYDAALRSADAALDLDPTNTAARDLRQTLLNRSGK